jgi:hypothetical protein
MDNLQELYPNMVYAPHAIPTTPYKKVFLAGSIEKGAAPDWQQRIAVALQGEKVLLLNPRRFSWDDSWRMAVDDPQFNEQVTWELEQLAHADLVVMNLIAGTQSPISLLEFGLYAQSGKMVVCCPEGFWRKGNIDMVCLHYDIPQVAKEDDLVAYIRRFITLPATTTYAEEDLAIQASPLIQ